MKVRTLTLLIVSVAISVMITYLSGFIQTPSSKLGVDVVYWGIPLSWTMLVIPTHFQSIDWLNFAADLASWTILILALSLSLAYAKARLSRREIPGQAV